MVFICLYFFIIIMMKYLKKIMAPLACVFVKFQEYKESSFFGQKAAFFLPYYPYLVSFDYSFNLYTDLFVYSFIYVLRLWVDASCSGLCAAMW